MKDAMVSDVGNYPNNGPFWLPIDANATKRDRFGNFKADVTDEHPGQVIYHHCKIQSLGEDDLRAFIQEMVYKNLINLEKWVRSEIKDIRETAQFRPVVWERKGNW